MPWWRIASVALLVVALGIAVANGHIVDAAIIAALILLGAAVVAWVIHVRVKQPGSNAPKR
jgi:hypothetical protein